MSALAADHDWMVRAISAPRPPSIQGHLRATAISARAGLDIYRHAYRARLEECLGDDFPALRALLGDSAFSALSQRTIRTHPPREATLNRYGRHLLRVVPRGAARDLARLEWALSEAIHAPLAPPIKPEDLAAIPAHAWARTALVTAPSLRLISSRYQIDDTYRQHLALRRLSEPQRQAITVAILRRSDGLHRCVLTPREGRLLRRLQRGVALADALGTELDGPAIHHAFATFTAAGLITATRTIP